MYYFVADQRKRWCYFQQEAQTGGFDLRLRFQAWDSLLLRLRRASHRNLIAICITGNTVICLIADVQLRGWCDLELHVS